MIRRTPTRPRQLPPCLPDGMKANDIPWEPDRTEILLANARVRQKLFDQEAKRCELEEQKAWLATAIQRMAAVALEIDEGLRRAALQEEIEKSERWWFQVHEREKAANAKVLEHFQDQLEGGVHAAM